MVEFKSSLQQCRRGQTIKVFDRIQTKLAVGAQPLEMVFRIITCEKTGGSKLEFQIGKTPEGLCEDCNLVR
jgi:hypothetical protein